MATQDQDPKQTNSKARALQFIRQWKKESGPLESLSSAISTAAFKGADQMKLHLNFPTEQQKHDQWFCVICEFIYFFLHLVSRISLNKLGIEKRQKIHDKLAPLILKSFVDVLGQGCLSFEEQERLTEDLYGNLMAAELDYASCIELIAKENPFEGSALFSVLASKLATQSGNDNDPKAFVEILAIAFSLYQETDLPQLVLQLGAAIE